MIYSCRDRGFDLKMVILSCIYELIWELGNGTSAGQLFLLNLMASSFRVHIFINYMGGSHFDYIYLSRRKGGGT